MNKSSYSKNNKSFYVILSLSILAVIAASVGITYTAKRIKADRMETTQSTVDWDNNSAIVSDEPANRHESNIPDDRITTTEEPKSEESTEKEEPTTKEKVTQAAAATTQKEEREYSLPLKAEILKNYSNGIMVKSKTMNDWRIHNGVDFTGEVGDEVKAVYGGTVTGVYDDYSWGKVVEIDHGDNVKAKYCGFESVNVKEGVSVNKDQVIGNLGTIPVESADNAHLHFEITVSGVISDPIDVLGKQLEEVD